MNGLIMYVGEHQTFRESPTLEVLQSMTNCQVVATTIQTVLVELQCELDGDVVFVRLHKDLETIGISGSGWASFAVAWNIARRLSEKTRLTDWD